MFLSPTLVSSAIASVQTFNPITISEVATDWHELMILQHIMWPSIACTNGQLDLQCS